MSQQPVRKGTWVEERMIGSGGFGAVHLWKDESTGERIALKRCRLQHEMTAKHKQRWELEVQIMQRLDHNNVIAAREVPPPLDVCKMELPLLAMEYCSGGDLRRVLNQPVNCCGIKEYNIRCLVHDVSAAVEYLHGKRIIHRDLKPENIVMKQVDDMTVYKIIDLGYAKELDQGSVCTSFVGTLQYLAPELFASQKYTCTVDYWSLGTVVFECITGYRPFLPTSPPLQWHKEVCRKSPDDICARVDEHGEVKFYKSIPTTNRLCRSMQTYIEQWLRMMLRWDPKARGGELKENRAISFRMLDSILSMKIIYLLNVSRNELLTYPILEQHTMAELQRRTEDETKVAVKDQDIILATGMTPDPLKPAAQCWLPPSDQECFVFLFQHGGGDLSPDAAVKNKPLPPSVQAIVREPDTMIPFSEQKKAWAESVLFCDQQYLEFKRLVLSQRAAMCSLLRADAQFVKTRNKMMEEYQQLMTKINYFQASLEHDMMFYKEQAKNGGVSSDRMHAKWVKMAEEVEGFKQFSVQVDELEQQAKIVQTKIMDLQRSPFARTKQDDTLEDLAKQARNVFQEFRQTYKDSKDAVKDQKPIVTVVVKSIMWREKKIPDLFAHLGKVGSCKATISQMLPKEEKCLQDITSSCAKLMNYQKQRQTSMWKLIEVAVQQGKTPNETPAYQQNDAFETLRFCRPDGVTEPSPPPTGPVVPSLMPSLMNSTTAMESLRVVEETKLTSKMMEETMNNLIQEQEEFTSVFTSLSISSNTNT